MDGRRLRERYLCPLGGAAGFGKIWAAEMRRCAARHRDAEEVCAPKDRDDVVPNVERPGRYKSQSPSADDDTAYREQGEGY